MESKYFAALISRFWEKQDIQVKAFMRVMAGKELHMEAKKLRDLFPMIRTREEILKEIEQNRNLQDIFESWEESRREDFLDSCSGVKGVRILYDSFFKAVMDPERDPRKLSELLSLILGRKVRVLRALPNEGGRVTPKTLVILDIIVQLEDGSITTVEVQRYGYAFPGERAACYSADMLLRQYKKKRDEASEAGIHMNYRWIKPVYTIVLYENSPGIFHKYKNQYIHYFEQTSDTGLKMELLEKYTFIALDNFKKILQNKGINNRLEAWLVFLSVDDPEWIEKLVRKYPEFKPMYSEVYELCRNLEEVMGMYSRELQELDEGTIQYMMDEMQEKLKEKDERLKESNEKLKESDEKIKELTDELKEERMQREKMISEIQELRELVEELQREKDAPEKSGI